MKRILVLLSAVLLAGALAACGGGGNDQPAAEATTAPPTQTAAGPTSQSPSSPTGTTTTPGSATGSATDDAGQAKATIIIENFTFKGPDSVPTGATITVTNKDTVAHTVTSKDDNGESFDVRIEPNATVTFTAPTQPGSYPYLCTIHPYMTATLTVT